MKKVAILTRTSTINFGTILQNYALQKVIAGMGYDIMTVDDAVPRKLYSSENSSGPSGVVQATKEYLYHKYDHIMDIRKNKRYHKAVKICDRFKKRYIKYYNVKSLKELNDDFDVFLSGSDQIWSDKAEPELFPYFMQDFVSQDKRKISFAVSVGAYFKENNSETVTRNLNNLDVVSVREQSSYDILREYFDGSIRIDCDPVLMLSKNEWVKLAGKRKIMGEYIFCYFLSDNEWYYNKIPEYIKCLGINSVYIYENIATSYGGYQRIDNCSPGDFLNHILYSDYVITDSFHALLFSVIFNKQVNVFKRYDDSVNAFQNGRIKQILGITGLTDHYIDSKKRINTKHFEYSVLDPVIWNLKNCSYNALRLELEI